MLAVRAHWHHGQRTLEDRDLRGHLCRDLGQPLACFDRDVLEGEEVAEVREPALRVEMRDLHTAHSQAGLFKDEHMKGHIGDVRSLDRGRRFHLDDAPTGVLADKNVDGAERIGRSKGCLE